MPRLLTGDDLVRAFEAHGRALSAIAAAWVGRSDMADLLQESARVAWQRRSQYVTGSDLRAWLAQIIRRVGANWRRRRRPVVLEFLDMADRRTQSSVAFDHSFDVEHLGLSDELARGLAVLSETARECLLLHTVAGHTFPEIASMLGIPQNTVQSHARRAREVLRAALTATTNGRMVHNMPSPEMS